MAILEAAKAPGTPDPATVAASRSRALQALNTVKQMAGRFAPDSEAKMDTVVSKLMEAPITQADGILGNLGPAELAAKGKALCDQFRPVANKFPFNPKAQTDVSLQELAALLKPGEGALWAFYDANLKTALPKPAYSENSAAGIPLNPRFVAFFKNAAAFSEAIYKDGADPKIPYKVTPLRSDNIEDLAMMLDGQVLNAPVSGGAAKVFTWMGSATHNAALSAKGVPPSTYQGLWAPFHLFADAEKFDQAGSGYNMEWYLRLSFAKTQAGSNAARFNLDLGAIPVFFRGNFSGMQCVSQVAK
jgi:type VI protein secretion system component VasK